ncbi:MAG: hypothetical protein ACO323_02660 [Candidatus Kapaibacteriota bacterium]|jgi:hypothetical protein
MSSALIVKAVPCFGDVCDADYRFISERGTLLTEIELACKDIMHAVSTTQGISSHTLMCTRNEKGDYTAEIIDKRASENLFELLPF